MDAIFKALNDPTRRAILDRLRAQDGQTLTELETGTEMTRFGVMKHLKLLEEAGLVVSVKRGRFRYHYLNALPLQEVIDRWIEPLIAKPAARAALDLKRQLEGQGPMHATTETRPDFVHQTYIRTDPETLWTALVDGAVTRRYYIAGAAVEGTPERGHRLIWRGPDGAEMLAGEVLEARRPERLALTFEPGWGDRAPSRMVYRIEPVDGLCRLTIEHYDLPESQQEVREGWARIASALKTLLETDAPLYP